MWRRQRKRKEVELLTFRDRQYFEWDLKANWWQIILLSLLDCKFLEGKNSSTHFWNWHMLAQHLIDHVVLTKSHRMSGDPIWTWLTPESWKPNATETGKVGLSKGRKIMSLAHNIIVFANILYIPGIVPRALCTLKCLILATTHVADTFNFISMINIV